MTMVAPEECPTLMERFAFCADAVRAEMLCLGRMQTVRRIDRMQRRIAALRKDNPTMTGGVFGDLLMNRLVGSLQRELESDADPRVRALAFVADPRNVLLPADSPSAPESDDASPDALRM